LQKWGCGKGRKGTPDASRLISAAAAGLPCRICAGKGRGEGTASHLGGPGQRSDAERPKISEFSITLLTSIKVANWKYLEPGKW